MSFFFSCSEISGENDWAIAEFHLSKPRPHVLKDGGREIGKGDLACRSHNLSQSWVSTCLEYCLPSYLSRILNPFIPLFGSVIAVGIPVNIFVFIACYLLCSLNVCLWDHFFQRLSLVKWLGLDLDVRHHGYIHTRLSDNSHPLHNFLLDFHQPASY